MEGGGWIPEEGEVLLVVASAGTFEEALEPLLALLQPSSERMSSGDGAFLVEGRNVQGIPSSPNQDPSSEKAHHTVEKRI